MTERYLILVESMQARDMVSLILFVCALGLVFAVLLLRRSRCNSINKTVIAK